MKSSPDKIAAYKALIQSVNGYNESLLHDLNLVASKNCQEINYWAYWEGGVDHLDADVLLVGQDWGAIDYKDEPIAGLMQRGDEISSSFCYMENNKNKTNMNICQLLKAIYDDVDFLKDCNTKKEIFFTNFVPWYRIPGAKISGGYDERWNEPSGDIFRRLVDIIRPQIVMCLGQKTYNNVCAALGMSKDKRAVKYADIVDTGYHVADMIDYELKVFPLMHPGYWGTRMRPIEAQLEDWKKVKKCIV